MDLSENMYSDMPLTGQQDMTVLVVVGVSATAVLVLALVTCVCWRRNSSGLFASRSDSCRDAVPLDDLLSKPSLADPESVFSEAGSCEFRLSPRAGSWFLASGEENSFFRDSDSTSGPSHGERDRANTHVAVGLNNFTDHTNVPGPRKSNYQNKQFLKASKSTQQQEFEQLQLQNRQNVDNEATSRLSSHQLKSTVECGYLSAKFRHEVNASVQTTSGSPRTGSLKDISEKVGLDPTALKIHRDSVPGENVPFLSSARCSFSHEVGHIVHGNKTPRPSLPKTDEVEGGHADSSSTHNNADPGRTAEHSVEVRTEQSQDLSLPHLTLNSQDENKSHGLLVRNDKSDNNHKSIIGYPRVSSQDHQKLIGILADSTTSEVDENPDNACRTSKSKSHVKNEVSAGRTTRHLEQCQLPSVTMRRCLSCVQDDVVCPDQPTRPRRQTFSLNLKIDVHFDNDRNSSENLPTIVCSPLAEYTRSGNHATTDNLKKHAISDRINNNKHNTINNNSNNQNTSSIHPNAKERELVKSFAEKSNHTKTHELVMARKRCSEPTIAEVSEVKNCNTRQLSRRFSQAEPSIITAPRETAGHVLSPGVESINLTATDAESARTDLAPTNADPTCEITAAGSPGNRASSSMAESADLAAAADSETTREITVAPKPVDGRATAVSDSHMLATQCELPEGNSYTTTDKTEVRAKVDKNEKSAETRISKMVPLRAADADRLQVIAGRSVNIGNIVISISSNTTETHQQSCDVTHILKGTDPSSLNLERLGKVKVDEENCNRKTQRFRGNGNKLNNKGDTIEIKDSQEHRNRGRYHSIDNTTETDVTSENSKSHPPVVDTRESILTPENTSFHYPQNVDNTQIVISRERADVDVHSIAGHCDPESIMVSTLSSPECVGDVTQTDKKTHPDVNLTEEFTNTKISGSVKLSGESSLIQTAAVDGATKSRDVHRRALTMKEGHARTVSEGNETSDAQFQRTSSLKMIPVQERVQRSLAISDDTKQRRQAVFFPGTENVTAEQVGCVSPEITLERDSGSVGGCVSPEITLERDTGSVGGCVSPEITLERDTGSVGGCVSPEITLERDTGSVGITRKQRQDREQTTASVSTARIQGRDTDSKVDTNKLNSKDAMAASVFTMTDSIPESGCLETFTKGHGQRLKERIAASARRDRTTTRVRKHEKQSTSADLLSESVQEKATAVAVDSQPYRLVECGLLAQQGKTRSSASASSTITINVEDSTCSIQTPDGSDDSDYDNPWDSLDDAVKRASIRYNRRPSRIAAGDNKTLLLKSAEDLGRLLEEADKRRQHRQTRNSCQIVSSETESLTIPFTRFSPHRHTVKDNVSQSHMATAHSSENILKTATGTYSKLSLLRQGDAAANDHTGLDVRRPMSLASKVRANITSPETKHGKHY